MKAKILLTLSVLLFGSLKQVDEYKTFKPGEIWKDNNGVAINAHGRKDAFIFMADRWNPKNAIDGRYVWLPVILKDNRIEIKWYNEWDLHYFGR